ncbi:MAG TPA: winged helix-turn-helix domain-containing protein [Vicinamibacteria bacterium]|nr:winged helix-turn-helix domain-containing protein [Vicinamibacteria bacterium]
MMTGIRPRPRLLSFGVFELDALTGELRKEGRLVRLRHQPVSVLRLLLERAGELVTRREITEELWPDDVDVDVEQGLNHCMKEIRAALGDRPDSPRFIQTLPRRGYRFLVEVHANGWDKRPPGFDAAAPAPEPAKAAPAEATADPDPDADQGFGDGRFE